MRTKRMLLCVLALMVALMAMSVPALADAAVAKIDTTEYTTLEAAFAAAQDGETITLLADSAGNGIKVPEGKFKTTGLTVDFNGHTYDVTGTLVGSTGTETNGFQLLKNNKITFQGGTITSTKAKILIQNYSNLTVENMTLTLNNPNYSGAYTLSNNNGNIVIDDTTINANPAGGFAFDVCRYSSYPSVNVTVTGNSAINGDVEVSASGSDAKDGFSLTLESGEMSGNVVIDNSAATAMAAATETTAITQNPSFTFYVAAVGSTKYESLEDALAAAPSRATVKLLADIDYSTTYTVRNARDNGNEHAVDLRDLTLDMNGHTISTINGTVEFGGDGATIKNGTFDLVHKSTQGTYQAGSYALIIDNTPPLSYGATGTVNVEDVTINGGLNVKGATVTVDEVTATTTASKYYAIWAETDATVTINSGTFTDAQTGGKGVIATGKNAEGGAVISINGGTFNAGNQVVYSAEADSVKIAGGTFTKAVAEEYCADGFNPVDNGSGTYGVAPVAASVTITKKDAYVDYDGLGYLRYVSTVNVAAGNTVEYFGTWFIPANLREDSESKEAARVQYDTTIESGKSFTADLLQIPAEALAKSINGVSFVKVLGQSEVSTDVATANVLDLKNWSSAE